MSTPSEKFPLIGACFVQVKIGEKWIQCTNPKSESKARDELSAKRKTTPACKFRLMKMTDIGIEEVSS